MWNLLFRPFHVEPILSGGARSTCRLTSPLRPHFSVGFPLQNVEKSAPHLRELPTAPCICIDWSTTGVVHKKDMRSIVLERKCSGDTRTALHRKESEISATSTGSRASSGGSFGSKREAKVEGKKSLSRAARLRQLGEARASLGGEVRTVWLRFKFYSFSVAGGG